MSAVPVYSTRFMAWAAVAFPADYTVGPGYVAVIRDVCASSGGGADTNFGWGLAGGVNMGRGSFTVESVPQQYHWTGHQIAYAGDTIVFYADEATDGAISGYLLTLP